jgi:hypothetical protein
MRPVTDRRLDRQVDAQDSPSAVAQLVECQRLGIVRILVELDGSDQRPTVLDFCEDESAIVESVVSPWQQPHAGNIETTIGGAYFVGQTHVGDTGDRVGCVARKVDAGHLADGTAPAVGTDEVSGLQLIRFIRRRDADFHTVRTRLEADQFVAPADVDAEFAGALGQLPDKPRLGHHQRVHRVIFHAEQRHRHTTEHPLVQRLWRIA